MPFQTLCTLPNIIQKDQNRYGQVSKSVSHVFCENMPCRFLHTPEASYRPMRVAKMDAGAKAFVTDAGSL